MSITFTAELGELAGYTITCECGETESDLYPTHAAALAAFKDGLGRVGSIALMLGCTNRDCTAGGLGSIIAHDVAGDAPALRLNAATASQLLDAVGITFDLSGTVDPAKVKIGPDARSSYGTRFSEVLTWCLAHNRALAWS